MKLLNIAEATDYLGEDKYAVSLENAWYRRLLYRVGDSVSKSERVARFFDPSPTQLSHVFLSMADWLPSNSNRLLWVEHSEDSFPSQKKHFLKVLGEDLETDHLVENPAILLGPLPSDLLDQLSGTVEQNAEAELLISLCTFLTVGGWDAKLLTTGSTDYIEFWEGNVLFHSESTEALIRATQILDYFDLKSPMT
ncbi:hypothetical protein [uncultured Pelagimonas sp.]|uniref:hypothetical protein n=1 Tax=uncultured Pelagimonas sp. TaxID=1618102 RepID=UPI002606C290|nr:hypothetical protein [uncultured Pelagimonas sp.]